ncbi:MAG TPA: NAD(+)/NADH kinase [Polyangiales bacterium]|nr:NAD(+)/NADH kinase [Polyangiales bacterium]
MTRSARPAPRVLVIYKKSAYQIYVRERRNERIQQLVAAGDPTAVQLLQAHEAHMRSLEAARHALARLGAAAKFRHRSHDAHAKGMDLVVTLGGDGTLLWASHLVGPDIPLVAINTAPKASVGYFCAGKDHEIESVLADALAGKLRETSLTRMQVKIDERAVSTRVLNDALFCHECPASTSRYALRVGRIAEDHKSSGVWIGPAAGSTAAQHSAGGKVLPVRSKALQYVVREPYQPNGTRYRLRMGLIKPGASLSLQSSMRAGRLYLDGPHDKFAVDMASKIEFSRSNEPLTLLGFHGPRR